MSEVKYLKDDSLVNLKKSIYRNLEQYKKENVWLDDYFDEDNYSLELRDSFKIKFNLLTDNGYKDDFENVKIIYDNFKMLTPAQASDERLWSYLTHVPFWYYMIKRWSVRERENKDENKLKGFIKSRYFFGFGENTDRNLSRNGIARLWWYGHISYDESSLDRYHLTKVLLTQQDFGQHLLESAFTRNPDITKAILSIFKELDEEYVKRDYIRPITEYLNIIGGVTILDEMTKNKFREIIYDKIAELE